MPRMKNIDSGIEKRCTDCGGTGPFGKQKRNSDGMQAQCLSCIKIVKDAWKRTPKGRACVAWAHIQDRAENRRGDKPAYANVKCLLSRQEFMAWAIPEYTRWMAENPGGSPSVDRIDSKGHYEIGNIRILDRWENAARAVKGKFNCAPPGMAWCGTCKAYIPIERFYKCRTRISGVTPKCRECIIKYKKEWNYSQIAQRAR